VGAPGLAVSGAGGGTAGGVAQPASASIDAPIIAAATFVIAAIAAGCGADRDEGRRRSVILSREPMMDAGFAFLLMEAALALALLVFIVWWTLPRKKRRKDDRPPPGQ
jgi:hypothetical protein